MPFGSSSHIVNNVGSSKIKDVLKLNQQISDLDIAPLFIILIMMSPFICYFGNNSLMQFSPDVSEKFFFKLGESKNSSFYTISYDSFDPIFSRFYSLKVAIVHIGYFVF